MKKILLISTGGTISHEHNAQGVAETSNAYKGNVFAETLERYKKRFDFEIDSKTILNKDSSNMTSSDWETIVNAIVSNYDNYDAFIVTHGTDTMGYTTAAVSFAIGNLGKPIAFTGSQVSYCMPGTDAVMNLENVLRVLAEHEELVGVFVVFGSKIITGTRVKKTTEFDYDAYKTFGRLPDIGYIGNSVVMNGSGLKRHLSYLGQKSKTRLGLDIKNKFVPEIVCLSEFPGLKSEYIINLAKSGVRGFILRATGAGNPNVAAANAGYPNLRSAFEYLQQNKIPIVVTTQVPDGLANMDLYEPAIAARKLGAIPGRDMAIEAVVTKLSWLLASDYGYDDIRTLMHTSFRGEIEQ